MTEIPEHLRKRAEEAREKAAAASGADAAAGDAPAAGGEAATRQSEAESKIPAHLLERSKAAKAKAAGGEAGGHRGGRRPPAVPSPPPPATARPAGRHRPGRSHPAPAHGRQVRLDPGRQGHPAGQGPRVAPPARGRVRGRAGLHGLHARLLDLRERPAARAGQPQPDAEPVEGAVVLPRPPGAAHDVPPDGGRRAASRAWASSP